MRLGQVAAGVVGVVGVDRERQKRGGGKKRQKSCRCWLTGAVGHTHVVRNEAEDKRRGGLGMAMAFGLFSNNGVWDRRGRDIWFGPRP